MIEAPSFVLHCSSLSRNKRRCLRLESIHQIVEHQHGQFAMSSRLERGGLGHDSSRVGEAVGDRVSSRGIYLSSVVLAGAACNQRRGRVLVGEVQ